MFSKTYCDCQYIQYKHTIKCQGSQIGVKICDDCNKYIVQSQGKIIKHWSLSDRHPPKRDLFKVSTINLLSCMHTKIIQLSPVVCPSTAPVF